MPLNSLNNSTRIDRPSTPTTGPGNGHAGAPPSPTGAASQQATGSATLQRLGAVRRQSRQGKTSGAGPTQGRGQAREGSAAARGHAP
uniref:hypothetical protein n=1 Tax=Burkholderia sp. Ac-20379 TaxID=2703900 RepID=UPI00197E1FDA